MATLFITEYDKASVHGGAAPVPQEPAIAEQAVTFTTTTQSAAFQPRTSFIRLLADADCHVLFGADPTATTSTQPLKANVEYFRGLKIGASHKVAAVTA